MKKLIALILFLVFLTSCGEEVVEKEIEKTDFFVNTTLGSEFSGETIFEKTGKVSSSQDISLSANANGRVSNILVKNGDTVRAGQIIARLDDNIGNYGISIQRASNGIERAKISYESNKISLDKQVFDAQLNLEKLERNLVALKSDSEQNLILAQDTLDNSQYDDLDTASALQLQQLDNNIEKAKLDYDNKLIADAEQIEGYKASIKKDYNSLLIFLDDIIEFSDEILGVTDLNRDENNKFEDFLGAKDSSQKSISEKSLQDLIGYRQSTAFISLDLELQSADISQERLIEVIDYINSGYEQSKTMLNNLETTLNNSVKSVGQLGDAELNSFLGSTNGYQSQLQGSYGGFISFGSSVKTFLRTYKNNQASILKGIELQEKDKTIQLKNLTSGELSASAGYERTVISIEDNIRNLESQLKTAQNNLDNAKKTRDVTLRSLQNSISEASIGYSSAANDYSKLTIRSPINGTISSISIDEGQEVFSGTKLFEIVSDKTPEVEIAFSSLEQDLVTEGQKVYIDVGRERIKGTIYSVSDVADGNLNYVSTIVFDSGTNLIGNIVTVSVPISTDKMMIPINIVTTKGDDIGTVKTLSGSTFNDIRIRMGEVFGEYVEVVSCAQQCEELKIITSDVSNFDENKFVIVEK